MTDAAASAAARELSRARWGSTRAQRLAGELVGRVDELPAEAAEQLRVALASRTTASEESG